MYLLTGEAQNPYIRNPPRTWQFLLYAVQLLLLMAITKGAKKATRSQERKRVFNVRTKRALAGTVKSALTTEGKDRKDQDTALSSAYKAIDKAAKRGVIKKNTAARKKSRLAIRLKKSTV